MPVNGRDEGNLMGSASTLSVEGGYGGDGDIQALVRAAMADRQAFSTLYDRYFLSVYAYLRSRAESDEDASDLTQQVFLQAMRGLPGYDERKGSFPAWLFRIARNAATDAHRRRRTWVSWESLPETLQGAVGGDPEEGALHRESLAQLRELFAGLASDKRELLWLRFASELEVREIALVVGKSPAAVYKGISRALRELEEGYCER